MRFKATAVALLAIAILVGTSWSSAGRSGAVGSEPRPSRVCGLPDESQMLAIARQLPPGHLDIEDWLANPSAQASNARLNASLAGFESALLGVASSNALRSLIVVVDPDASLQTFAMVERVVTSQAFPFRVEVRAGCHSLAELDAVSRSLTNARSASWASAA